MLRLIKPNTSRIHTNCIGLESGHNSYRHMVCGAPPRHGVCATTIAGVVKRPLPWRAAWCACPSATPTSMATWPSAVAAAVAAELRRPPSHRAAWRRRTLPKPSSAQLITHYEMVWTGPEFPHLGRSFLGPSNWLSARRDKEEEVWLSGVPCKIGPVTFFLGKKGKRRHPHTHKNIFRFFFLEL